jgi:O-antigen/teichoic acid export membrane protein
MTDPINTQIPPETKQKNTLLSGTSAIRVLSNIVSMFVSGVFIRGSSFILYLLVGRLLGVYEFGQVSLALSLFSTSQGIAVEWIATYITREVAKNLSGTGRFLMNGSLASILASSISLVFLYGFVKAMGYNPDTISVVMWVAIGLVPNALSVVNEAIFQAWERMHFIVIAQFVGSVFKIAAIWFLLVTDHGIAAVVYVLIASHVLVLVLEWIFIGRYIKFENLVFSLSGIRQILQDSTSFFGLNIVLAVRASLSVVLITKLLGETSTGLFSSAAQFTVPVSLVTQSVTLSLFPIMVRQFGVSAAGLERISTKSFELVLIMVVPAVVFLTLLADKLLILVYGSEYVMAANVLRIMAWMLLMEAFAHVYGRVLYATNRERLSFQLATGVTFIWIVIQYLFIMLYDIEGAAWGIFTANIVNLLAHYIPVTRLLFKIPILPVIWKSGLASLVMAVVVVMLRDQHVLVNIAVSGVVYCVVWGLIAVVRAGSIRQFKVAYVDIWANS